MVIIALFILMGVTISNMVTITAFSSCLSEIWYKFDDSIESVVDLFSTYECIPWLYDYLVRNDWTLETVDENDILSLVKDLSERTGKDPYDMTYDELDGLSPELREMAVQYLYAYTTSILDIVCWQSKMEDVIFVIKDKTTEKYRILLNVSTEPGCPSRLGEEIDYKKLKTSWDRGASAMIGNLKNWGWKRPKKTDEYGLGYTVENEKVDLYGILYSTVSGEKVYSSMVFMSDIRRSINTLVIFSTIVILLILYVIVIMPLARLKQIVGNYQQHKDAARVEEEISRIQSRNEIGVFAEEFASLTREMERYTKEVAELAGERKRVDTQLEVATRIQTGMLPHDFPDRREFKLYASMNPALEVGGDFYDFYFLDEDHLVLTIADVSGKGIPGALFMAVSKAIMKNRTLLGGTPAEILADVNNQLCEGNIHFMFVTAWLGILTISTGMLVCANAGHENPGMRFGEKPFSVVVTRHGLVLGGFNGLKYNNEQYQFHAGDALFLYTDGIPEATRADEQMFGMDRLEEVLQKTETADTPEQILSRVSAAVEDFVGDTPQFDDMTMMALIYLGASKEH